MPSTVTDTLVIGPHNCAASPEHSKEVNTGVGVTVGVAVAVAVAVGVATEVPIKMDWVNCDAAAYKALPELLALIVHVPRATGCTLPVTTVQ
ncbi:MAG: hypothetical protein WCK30_06765, partial [Actinomycetes bacterium]